MHHRREPELTGRIVVPESPQYDAARQVFNQYFNRFPSIIVYAGDTQDVVNAIRWARCRNIPVRIRSGGHNYEGLSALNNGMVIDVSTMKSIWADPRRGIAIVQPGVENNEIYHALGEKGMVVPGGVCPTPAIAGVGLGGGHSMLVRAFGLTLDHLLEVEMVDACGRILYANDQRNADLFWALRGGGGGNFGICTAFCFRTCPIDTVCMADIGWGLDDMEPVLKAWQALTVPGTDKRLTPILTIASGTAWTGEASQTPEEQPSPINMQAIYLGPLARLRELLQPLLDSGTPQRIMIKELPWLEAVDRLSAPQPRSPIPFKSTDSFIYGQLPDKAIAIIRSFIDMPPDGSATVLFHALGGAVAEVHPRATAYFHRTAWSKVALWLTWNKPEQAEQNIRWEEGLRTALLPYTRGIYVNSPNLAVDDWPRAYYGGNFRDLTCIKARYDPHNVFHFPQSIPPARWRNI